MDKLTTEQKRAIAYIEQYWYQNNEFPATLPVGYQGLKELLSSAAVRVALSDRGIDGNYGLTEEMIAAIATVCNFADQRSRARKLKDMGISATKWAGWMRNPRFVAFLHKVSSDELQSNLHVAHEGVLRAVDKGSEQAVRLYMELTNRATSATEQNLRQVLAHLIESIQRHVSDPDAIKAIQRDFSAIMAGELPTTYSPKALDSPPPIPVPRI